MLLALEMMEGTMSPGIRKPLTARRDQETDYFLEPSERKAALLTFDFSLVRCILDF